jgi:hypothetical protein
LPASAVSVARIALGGVDRGVAEMLGVSMAAAGSPPLSIGLDTPRGRVELVAA